MTFCSRLMLTVCACSPFLQVLQLSHNAMEVLPISLLSLTALTYLDLSYNRLMLLPFWIGSTKLQQLRRLNLVRNTLMRHLGAVVVVLMLAEQAQDGGALSPSLN